MKTLRVLSNIFLRKHFYQTNVCLGTNYWSEVFGALRDSAKPDIIYGPGIAEYENKFSKTVGAKACFSFSAGRMALYAILESLGIGEGDEVIVLAFTCVAVPNAIIYTGAKPVYCDVETERFGPDPESLKSKITPRTKAIIAQHTFGIPCRIDEIMEIANSHGIPVIEDCAHTMKASYKGRVAGNIGLASFFSSDQTKIISTSIGGMAASNDETFIKKLREVYEKSDFLSVGQVRKQAFSFVLFFVLSFPEIYWIGRYVNEVFYRMGMLMYIMEYNYLTKPKKYPYPARFSNLHAKIGISQLNHLAENLDHRLGLAKKFDDILGANKDILNNSDIKCDWLRYPFLVENRDEFINSFKKYHDLGIWFTQVAQCREKDFDEIGYETGSCPKAEWATKRIVSIPTHFRMDHLENMISEMKKLKMISPGLYFYKK